MTGWNEQIKKSLGYCGSEVKIAHNVIFTNPSKVFLGNRVRIDPFTLITTELETGDNVQVCAGAVLGGGSQHKITLGDWCFIGYHSQLFCASESYDGTCGPVNEYWGSNKIFRGNIKFNDHSGIASQVIVMPGVELLEGCLIGAQSFVYKAPTGGWAIYKGNPCEFHRMRDKEACLKALNTPGFIKDRSND